MYNRSTIHDKLEEIKESIELIQEWSKDVKSADDFMLSPTKYMAFNACVMRLHMRNMISHEYANVDETIVYDTIKNGLPELKIIIEDLLQQY